MTDGTRTHNLRIDRKVNVACVDYSVAKNGKLCAYRWGGEEQIDAEKFVWVPAEVK